MISKLQLAACLAVLVLSGCASVSVERETWRKGKVSTPPSIVVEPFTASPEVLRVDRSGAELEEFRARLGTEFAGRLAERLARNVAPTRVADGNVRRGEWVIEGEFQRVAQGSRLLRSFIGWGLGGTKMEILTKISLAGTKGTRTPIAEIRTTGGSNAEPGAIFSGPIVAAPRAILNASLSGVSADSRRSARTITAAISEKLASEGQPLAGDPLVAKRLGSIPEGNSESKRLPSTPR